MFALLLVVIYLSFISLGLPDGLLGAAWPSMYQPLGVELSSAGLVSMIISGGTVVSALLSERLVKKLGTGFITMISVSMTAVALFGFSSSHAFWQICIWAVPYGLGAGSVDAALNNFVAIHYKSRHMSWLHCFWGVGCSVGPSIMSYCLTVSKGWRQGYFTVFLIQLVLVTILIFSFPLWKRVSSNQVAETVKEHETKVYGLRRTLKTKGVKGSMFTFFCYCAMEQTVGLWAVTYLVLARDIHPNQAASYGALYFIGIMVGRFLSGFMTEKISDKNMVRIGQGISLLGILFVMIPMGNTIILVGLIIIGLGFAPIYPCNIHATPYKFGADISQAVIGVQMAFAYVGTCLMPPVFGLIAQHISISLFPVFLIVMWIFMTILSEGTNYRLNSDGTGLKERANKLKLNIPAIFICLKTKDTPVGAKIMAGITIGYALSPIDFIPDFIPVLGYLDDIILLPILVALTIKMIPDEILSQCKKQAEGLWKNGKPKKWYYAIPIILFWLIMLWLILKMLLN